MHEEASSPKKKKKAGRRDFVMFGLFHFSGRGYDVKLNQPKVPPVSAGAAKPTNEPAKAPG